MTIEFDIFNKKSMCFVRSGMIEIKTAASRKTIGNCLFHPDLSAIFPPQKLPRANPRRVTPITDVQVKSELPSIGAIILEEISSTVIIENPATKEPSR